MEWLLSLSKPSQFEDKDKTEVINLRPHDQLRRDKTAYILGEVMERLIELLHERNKYLEKFHNMNEKELVNFEKGQFENLESFYNNREGILNRLSKLEDRIGDIHKMEPFKFGETDQKETLKAVQYKKELVLEILSQDLRLLSFVESEKTNIIKDLVRSNGLVA